MLSGADRTDGLDGPDGDGDEGERPADGADGGVAVTRGVKRMRVGKGVREEEEQRQEGTVFVETKWVDMAQMARRREFCQSL